MKPPRKTRLVRVSEATAIALRLLATRERRTMGAQVAHLVEQALADSKDVKAA